MYQTQNDKFTCAHVCNMLLALSFMYQAVNDKFPSVHMYSMFLALYFVYEAQIDKSTLVQHIPGSLFHVSGSN